MCFKHFIFKRKIYASLKHCICIYKLILEYTLNCRYLASKYLFTYQYSPMQLNHKLNESNLVQNFAILIEYIFYEH